MVDVILEVMVLTADLHAAKRWVRGRFVALGEGGGPRSSAHPDAVSAASTSAPPGKGAGLLRVSFAPPPPPPPPPPVTALRLGRSSVLLAILPPSPPPAEDNPEGIRRRRLRGRHHLAHQ